jgi:hypothetical protein
MTSDYECDGQPIIYSISFIIRFLHNIYSPYTLFTSRSLCRSRRSSAASTTCNSSTSNQYPFPNPPPFYQYQGPIQVSWSTLVNNTPPPPPITHTQTLKCDLWTWKGGRKRPRIVQVPDTVLSSTHCSVGPSDVTPIVTDEDAAPSTPHCVP